MNPSRTHLFLMAAAVATLGVAAGTVLWLKLAPKPQAAHWNTLPLEGLNRYGPVPAFDLVERSGSKISLADLRGKVWIADFIYTSCEDTCPLQTATMAKLQERWAKSPELTLVSFSVDPERDDPAVLSRYADRFKADARRWLFLTGGKEEIGQLVQDGFRLSAAAVTEAGSHQPVILHSPRFVLIDRKSDIRGYYDSRDPGALSRLNQDVATLLKDQGSG